MQGRVHRPGTRRCATAQSSTCPARERSRWVGLVILLGTQVIQSNQYKEVGFRGQKNGGLKPPLKAREGLPSSGALPEVASMVTSRRTLSEPLSKKSMARSRED